MGKFGPFKLKCHSCKLKTTHTEKEGCLRCKRLKNRPEVKKRSSAKAPKKH